MVLVPLQLEPELQHGERVAPLPAHQERQDPLPRFPQADCSADHEGKLQNNEGKLHNYIMCNFFLTEGSRAGPHQAGPASGAQGGLC